MLRLKANKTALYKLVADYVDNLPPMRSGTEFIKYPRTPDYALNWITPEWDTAHAFFSACMGRPLLAIEIKDGETGKTVSRTTHALTLRDLRERGMVEHGAAAVIDGDRLLWRGDTEVVAMDAVRKARSSWAKEWERAVWNALEGVDLHKEEA